MSLNPLATLDDYQSMLNRIFWFTTASALVATWMLRLRVPELDQFLRQIDFTVALDGNKILPVPGGFLIPALAVGMVTRIYRLHARISDWLGIRECFDVDVIIAELAAQLEIDLSTIERSQLERRRHRIMRKAFYPFVSSSHPQIDPQLVRQALDAWSWFWVGIEASFVFALTGMALIACGVVTLGLQVVGGTVLLAMIGLPAMRGQCQRYAIAQVRAILADRERATKAREAFSELAVNLLGIRRAA